MSGVTFQFFLISKKPHQSVSRFIEPELELVPLRHGTEKGIDTDNRPGFEILLKPFALARSFRLANLHQLPVLVHLRLGLQREGVETGAGM